MDGNLLGREDLGPYFGVDQLRLAPAGLLFPRVGRRSGVVLVEELLVEFGRLVRHVAVVVLVRLCVQPWPTTKILLNNDSQHTQGLY